MDRNTSVVSIGFCIPDGNCKKSNYFDHIILLIARFKPITNVIWSKYFTIHKKLVTTIFIKYSLPVYFHK